MLDAIKKTCEGYTLESLTQNIKWVEYILGIVDDARQYANNWMKIFQKQSIVEFNMRHSAGKILSMTGGELECNKCSHNLMHWTVPFFFN